MNHRNKYGYRYLITLTLAVLGVAFAVFWGEEKIFRNTYASQNALMTLAYIALVITCGACLWFFIHRSFKNIKISGYFLLPVVVFIASFLMLRIPLYAALHFMDGTETQFITTYTYSSGGRNSCSGASIWEPELNRQIRICYPQGYIGSRGNLRVHKTSNRYGLVITDAWGIPE